MLRNGVIPGSSGAGDRSGSVVAIFLDWMIMQTSRRPRVVLRYGLAALSVGAAAVLTRLLKGFGDAGISPQFFAAVILSAWYGGLGPGFLATFLSGLATAWLLLTPRGWAFHAVQDEIVRLLVFTIVSVLAGSLHGAMRRAADASRRAKEAAESASAAKSRFLAMVSHELRTPLSPVLMVAEMLAHDPALPAAMLGDIQTIRRNVDLEIRLIGDLVDLTRITAGKMSLASEVIDIHKPLLAAIAVCALDLRDKQLDLSTQWLADDARIAGDPVRMQQVFWNLLRNAVKFTPVGGRVSIISRRLAGDKVSIEFSDTGIGIPPERLAKIFEAFEQAEPDIQVRFGGLGLGLAICQALVEAHHGSITAQSEGRDHGATFTVVVPLAPQSLDSSTGPTNVRGSAAAPSHGIVGSS